jgi:hypothetical protein
MFSSFATENKVTRRRRRGSKTPMTATFDLRNDSRQGEFTQGQPLSRIRIPSDRNSIIEYAVKSFFATWYGALTHFRASTISPYLSFSIVPREYSSEDKSQHKSAVLSVSLAQLSVTTRIPETIMLVERQYTETLPAINAALNTPTSALSDETLMTIEILSLAEFTRKRPSIQLLPWWQHVQGATEIVKQREPTQLNTRLGVSLFLGAKSRWNETTISSCVMHQVLIRSSRADWEIAAHLLHGVRKQYSRLLHRMAEERGWQLLFSGS